MINSRTIITIFLLLVVILTSKSQVGIGINNAKGVFHIDANRDTESSNGTIDDVIITNEGNVGIGTLSPTKKLDVNGTTYIKGDLSIKDGTQQQHFILMSDKDGNTSWRSPSQIAIIDVVANNISTFTNDIESVFKDATMTFSGNSKEMGIYKFPGLFVDSNLAFILPQGQYQIILDLDINGASDVHPLGILNFAYTRKPDDNSNITDSTPLRITEDIFLIDKMGGASFVIALSDGTSSYNSPCVFTLLFKPMPLEFYGTSQNTGYFSLPPYSGKPKARISIIRYQPVGIQTQP